MLSVNTISQKLKSLKIYPQIAAIESALSKQGRVCWLAGGVVRDLIIGREFNDIDLVTDATESEILKLFPQSILVGQSFGVFKIPMDDGQIIDLTYFREEDGYLDGRRPTVVKQSTPEQDALRRDFTINALFWDLNHHALVDYCGGFFDLEHKILKAVGDPSVRFSEDALRLVRLVRFSVQLDFFIEENTLKKAFESVSFVKRISGERIYQEISKIKNVDQRKRFWSSDLVKAVFVEIGFMYDLTKFESVVNATVIHDLFFMMGADQSAIESLVSVLKISKNLKNELEKIYSVLTFQGDDLDLCIEMEDSDSLRYVVQSFFAFKRADSLRLLEMAPVRLVQPKDILGLVRPENIKKSLRAVRREQFLGRVLDVKSALDFVKNLND